MPFWKKPAGKKLLNTLKEIRRELNYLSDTKAQKKQLFQIINTVNGLLQTAKKEILEVAEEEKRKPWLAIGYDDVIDALAREEIAYIERLKEDMGDYHALLQDATEAELKEIAEAVQELGIQLKDRIRNVTQRCAEMEDATIRSRMEHPSLQIENLTTKEGTPMSRIVQVVRALGGTIEKKSGKHPYAIIFPNGSRPIPLSKDVDTQKIAKQVREALQHSFPEHKIPTVSHLRRAMTGGDIRLAA